MMLSRAAPRLPRFRLPGKAEAPRRMGLIGALQERSMPSMMFFDSRGRPVAERYPATPPTVLTGPEDRRRRVRNCVRQAILGLWVYLRLPGMTEMLIGYARASTDLRTSQRSGTRYSPWVFSRPACTPMRGARERTGTGRVSGRPPQRAGLATLSWCPYSTDSLAPDLIRDISADLVAADIRLSLGGAIHDPTDPVGGSLFNARRVVAELEADLMGGECATEWRSHARRAGFAVDAPKSRP